MGPCSNEGYSICAYKGHQDLSQLREFMGFFSGNQPKWSLLDGNDPSKGLKLTFLNGEWV